MTDSTNTAGAAPQPVEQITEGDLQGRGVTALPDVPQLSAAELKAKFEELVRSVVIPKLNEAIGTINAVMADEYIPGLISEATAPIEGHIGDLAALRTEAKESLVAAINEAAESGGAAATPDWSQNDPAGAGYIANRPFYAEGGMVEVMPETTLTAEDAGEAGWLCVGTGAWYSFAPVLSEAVAIGDTLTVTCDGAEYTCVVTSADGLPAVGDFGLMNGGESTGEPFVLGFVPDGMVGAMDGAYAVAMSTTGASSMTVSITKNAETVHKIDPKFLPEMGESVSVHYLTGAYGIHAFPAADFEAAMAAYFAGKNLLYMAGLLVCDVALDGDYYNIRLARYPLQVLGYQRRSDATLGDMYVTFAVPYEGAGIAASYINALDIDGVPQDLEYRFTAQGYIEVDGTNTNTDGIAGGYIYPVATEMPSGAKLLGVGDSADHTLQWYDIPEAATPEAIAAAVEAYLAENPPAGAGAPGITLTDTDTGCTLTVTNGDEVQTVSISDGAKGDKGDKGDTGSPGADGADGYTPVKGTDYFTEADKAELVAEIIAEGKRVFDDGATLALTEGETEWRASIQISSLTVTYPAAGGFEAWITFETADSGSVAVSLPESSKYIGTVPTFGNGEQWELSIKDGVVTAAKVSA